MAAEIKAYLAREDPDASFKILTGGVVNVVARVTGGRFPGHQSYILKYAPPYVAGVGESAPLSQFRQTIEARALSLLATIVPKTQSVSIPAILKHDTKNHVLMISDLGSLPNLSEAFSNIGGFTPMIEVPPMTPIPSSESPSEEQLKHYMSIGAKIGTFFAQLHAPSIAEKILSDPALGRDYLSTAFMRAGVLEYAIKPVRAHLAKFPDILSADEADTLYQRIEDNFTRHNKRAELSMVLGDCWTGATLVDPDATKTETKVGIIDWEFSNLHRGMHGDIAQLLAHFETFRIAAEYQGSDYYVGLVDAITDSLCIAYRSKTLELSPPTLATTRSPTPTTPSPWAVPHGKSAEPPPSNSLRAGICRSAMLGHAAEIVNVAFWKVWRCSNPFCPRGKDGLAHTTVLEECLLIKGMVERAVWYARRAGKDKGEFCRKANWAELIKEAELENGKGLLALL